MEVFTPVSDKEQARYNLYGLQQTTSVQAYTMAFRELTFAIHDLSAAEAKTLYEKGPKRDIWNDIRLRFPTTLEEVITLAEQIDAVAGGNAAQIRPGVLTANPAIVIANRLFFARRGGGANRPHGARLNGIAGPNVLGHTPGFSVPITSIVHDRLNNPTYCYMPDPKCVNSGVLNFALLPWRHSVGGYFPEPFSQDSNTATP